MNDTRQEPGEGTITTLGSLNSEYRTTLSTKSFSPDTSVQRFEHQVSGHDKLISINDGALIVKPCNDIECDFYENSVLHLEFAKWMPKYYGRLQLQGTQSNLSTISPKILEAVAAGLEGVSSINVELEAGMKALESIGTVVDKNVIAQEAICIENLLLGFKKPCIMDVKLGTQYYGPDANEEKRKRLIAKAESSTSAKLGLRLTGLKVYNNSNDSYSTYERKFGYNLTEETIVDGLAKFFTSDLTSKDRRLILERFIKDLEEYYGVIQKQELRMYGSSLLFVYEGDQGTLSDALVKEKEFIMEDQNDDEEDEDEDEDEDDDEGFKVMDLRAIDFAHSCFQPGIGKDEGYLLGIENLKKYFRQILGRL